MGNSTPQSKFVKPLKLEGMAYGRIIFHETLLFQVVEARHPEWWYKARYARFGLVCLTFLIHIPADMAALDYTDFKKLEFDESSGKIKPSMGTNKTNVSLVLSI